MDDSIPRRHGAFLRKEAVGRFGASRVRREQESGRWTSPWPGVLVEVTRVADPLTLMAAAVLFGNEEAVLAGPTAAHLHGCRSVSPTPVHIMVPYGHWLRSRPGLVVHNGPLLPEDLDTRCDLSVLGFDRALTDVLCTLPPTDALAVADEALAMIEETQREKYRAAIAERLVRRPDIRGTRRGALLLDLATGKAASPAESWLLWKVVDAGFPVPEVNWSLVAPNGHEVYRLDLAWPELRICVEYNGHAVHIDQTAEDEARLEDLRRRGWRVVVAWASDLASPGRYESELQTAFLARGIDMSRRRVGRLRGRRHRDAA
jgi:hypothetical protein